MNSKKSAAGDAAQSEKLPDKKGKASKEPFYKAKWFYVVVAVVLVGTIFGAGIAIGSSVTNKNTGEEATIGDHNADGDADKKDGSDQKEQKSDDKKDNGGSNEDKDGNSASDSNNKPAKDSVNNAGVSSSGASNPSNDLKNDGKGVYGVGETASFLGYEVKVTKVERNYKPKSSSIKPLIASNDEFVRVTVEVKNASNKDGNYNSLDWSIDASDGVPTGNLDASCTKDKTCLSAGELLMGKKVSGTMVFELPKKATWAALHYQPIYTYEGDIVFELY